MLIIIQWLWGKENIKVALKSKLVEIGVMTADLVVNSPATNIIPIQTHELTFEQQKELLLIQMEHDPYKHNLEIERKKIDMEMIRQQTEQIKLDRERHLSLGIDAYRSDLVGQVSLVCQQTNMYFYIRAVVESALLRVMILVLLHLTRFDQGKLVLLSLTLSHEATLTRTKAVTTVMRQDIGRRTAFCYRL